MTLPPSTQNLLRCPCCREKIKAEEDRFQCINERCGESFPIVGGIPILINRDDSLFDIDRIDDSQNVFHRIYHESRAKAVIRRFLPTNSLNLTSRRNFARLLEELLNLAENPKVLVIGGGVMGVGMETLVNDRSLELIECDVVFGPRTKLICDAHEIPFEDGTIDGVVIQAVLEHAIDPRRCVEEIHRVLREDGLVYSETAFMQQVHGGPFDFMRFTRLGHRRLFRAFEELDSGIVCGPGMALAWSYEYFLRSFANGKGVERILRAFAWFTGFFWKYFDYFLAGRKYSFDAASGFYFLGKRSGKVLTDRELISLYR